MTTTNKYTELEQQIIDNIKKVDTPNYFFVSDILTSNTKQMRGAIASLVKKGVLDINTQDGGLVSVLDRSDFPEGFFS